MTQPARGFEAARAAFLRSARSMRRAGRATGVARRESFACRKAKSASGRTGVHQHRGQVPPSGARARSGPHLPGCRSRPDERRRVEIRGGHGRGFRRTPACMKRFPRSAHPAPAGRNPPASSPSDAGERLRWVCRLGLRDFLPRGLAGFKVGRSAAALAGPGAVHRAAGESLLHPSASAPDRSTSWLRRGRSARVGHCSSNSCSPAARDATSAGCRLHDHLRAIGVAPPSAGSTARTPSQ